MICVIHAHPYPHRSRTNRLLADALRALPDVDVRSLYDLYPDFDIDVATEQRTIENASLIVWMHPLFWYSVPALMKHWFDKVLAYGFAYGEGGDALTGKHCLWVPTTGGDEQDFAAGALHRYPFTSFTPPIEQTARFCGMHWEPPYVVYGVNTIDDARSAQHASALIERIERWRQASVATV